MVSPSEEWILLSEGVFTQSYIDSLAEMLALENVKTVLEACCGGGHILYGLARKGFACTGVDADPEMVAHAKKTYRDKRLSYLQEDVRSLHHPETYDAVICRGNSLVVLTCWNQDSAAYDPRKAKSALEKSVSRLYQQVRPGGLLVIDTISDFEIRQHGGPFLIDVPGAQLEGVVGHDRNERKRIIHAIGEVMGEPFSHTSASYLITPDEMTDILLQQNPSLVWRPKFPDMPLYDLICAKKRPARTSAPVKSLLLSHEREEDHVPDARAVREEHDEPVHADPHA